MESKKDIRKRVLAKRSSITEKEWEEKSRRIYEKVVTHPFFLNADEIYCYVDYKQEAGTRRILEAAWSAGKKAAVPKIENDEMKFYYIQNVQELEEGYCGIFEPQAKHLAEGENVLVIMPGCAFDRDRNRIGYGKAFYDRYLKAHDAYHTLALAFELQLVEAISADMHDIKPEVIVTEEKIYDEHTAK